MTRQTKAQMLAEQFGGVWKYDHHCVWESDDGRRVVRTKQLLGDTKYRLSCVQGWWSEGNLQSLAEWKEKHA